MRGSNPRAAGNLNRTAATAAYKAAALPLCQPSISAPDSFVRDRFLACIGRIAITAFQKRTYGERGRFWPVLVSFGRNLDGSLANRPNAPASDGD